MSNLRQAAQQALEALVIGSDAAHEVAQNYHEAMAGYRPARHIAVDDDVRKIEAAIAALRAALADGDNLSPTEPVAWYHVPHPGNGISPVVSMFQQHEPSLYAVAVPLFIREQL